MWGRESQSRQGARCLEEGEFKPSFSDSWEEGAHLSSSHRKLTLVGYPGGA